jgi:hypothetical protein
LFIDTVVYNPSNVSYIGTASAGPKKHEHDKHVRYPTHDGAGLRIAPFDLLAVAISTLGGIGPEGAKGLRSRLVGAAPSVFPRIACAVVKFSTRAILDAHGVGGFATAHPRARPSGQRGWR